MQVIMCGEATKEHVTHSIYYYYLRFGDTKYSYIMCLELGHTCCEPTMHLAMAGTSELGVPASSNLSCFHGILFALSLICMLSSLSVTYHYTQCIGSIMHHSNI